MSFTRDDLKAYEASTPAAPAVVPDPAPPAAAPPAPAPAVASSATEGETDPAASGDDGSTGDLAASPPASADPEGEVPDPAAAPPRKGGAQERIEDLVAERNSLREYGKFLQAKVAELAGTPPAAPAADAPPATTPSVDEDVAPTLEAHEYDPVAFAAAQNKWLQKQVDKRVAAALQAADANRFAETARANFEKRAADFAKTHPDFAIVTQNPNLPKLANTSARLIVLSEAGPALAHHLATNLDVATRIARMTPDQQAMALGRIEAQLTAAPAPASTKQASRPRTVSQAPAPPTPIAGGSASTPKSKAEMSMEEWVAADRAEKIARREQLRKGRAAMR